MADSTYTFLPWVRQGAATAISAADPLDGTLDSRVEIELKALAKPNDDPATITPVAVRLYGPGDITGFDDRQVVRTEPAHLSSDFEPNYFPAIEFDRPDFPWLFTPASADPQDRLRPWLCLVVVEKREGILTADPARPLPVLSVADPSQDLPDPQGAWAWAHAQISGPVTATDVNSVLDGSQERTVSRLLCPRKLKPKTPYYACVVPAFEVGRKAGLGEPIDDQQPAAKLTAAWDVSSTAPVDLPVYYQWEFATGAEGDFESLVWALQRQSLTDVGARDCDCNDAAAELPPIGILGMEGALRAGPPPAVSIPAAFQDRLRDLLNTPDPRPAGTPAGNLALAPPIYGRWHAAQRAIPDGVRDAAWLRDLNLDPRYRVAASLGARVVEDQQEQLMTSAWQQVGDIERANQALRQAQLARATGTAIHAAHLAAAPGEQLLVLTAPAHTRVLTQPGQTLGARVRASIVPAAAVQGPFRRLTRARGPLSRRLGGSLRAGNLVRRLNAREISPAPPPSPPRGMVTMDTIVQAATGAARPLCNVRTLLAQRLPELKILPNDPPAVKMRKSLMLLFYEAAMRNLQNLEPCEPVTPPPRPSLDLAAIRTTLLAALDPETTVPARINARLTVPSGWKPADLIEPVMAAPVFPAPMYKALAALSKDLLLPGVDRVPPNTITALESNPEFIEAFMVGLNHEMSRKLLWRGYPTDQRGTYFRQFWDPAGHVPPPASDQDREALKDIAPISGWDPTKKLGENLGGVGAKSQTLLLIRGELLRRYPRASIYAAKAEWSRDAQGNDIEPRNPVAVITDPNDPNYIAPGEDAYPEKYPVFQGALPADLTFLGFNLPPDAVAGNPDPSQHDAGWFFVLQQQPTEPRFGLDETPPGVSTGSWEDLSWQDVDTTPGGYIRIAQPLKNNFPQPVQTPDSGIQWGLGLNGGAAAYITLQRPFRVAIHGSDLL